MMYSILAIDPGVTTGICTAILTADELVMNVGQHEFPMIGMEEYLERTIDLRAETNLHIIYEDFQFRNASRSGLNLYPAKLQGVIELISEKNPQVPFYAQQPSVQGDKAYFSNDRLRELGIYKRGTEHGRSAQKHLLHWLAFKEGSQYADIEKLELKLV